MTAEEFIENRLKGIPESQLVYGLVDYNTIKEWLEEYADLVLKIAAQKAKIKRNYYPNEEALDSQIERRDFNDGDYSYFISLESIINCLKE